MRHRNLLIITLLLTLLTGGWGGVVAAAFCAHDAKHEQPAAMAENHDCCRVELEHSPEHCAAAADSSSSASHEAMAIDETEAMPFVVKERAQNAAAALGQFDEACLHCVSRGGLPTTFIVAREPEQKRRDANVALPPAVNQIVSPVATFVPFPSARQHAPPGSEARRHLLLNVFVI
jgi:hypothetical protein